VTRYQQLAIDLTATLNAFRGSIPGLQRASAEAKILVQRKRRIPRPFVTAAVGSLSASPELQGLKQVSTEQATDDDQFVAAIRPLAMTLVNLGKDLQHTVEAREAQQVTRAQMIYAVARGLSLDRDSAAVAPFVETMKRTRARRLKSSKSSEPSTPPVPPVAAGKAEGGVAA
jgi:hypothetical protein